MELSGEPGEYRCPVWACRKNGDRWVDLHGWRLAVCADHADDVEADPWRWQVKAARPDGTLRIARTSEPAPDGWDDEPKKQDPKEATT